MAVPMSPYAYRAGKSVLHHMNGGVKLLGVLALSVFAYSSLAGLAVAAVLVGGGALLARLRPWALLRGSKPLVVLAVLVVLGRGLAWENGLAIDRTGLYAGLREGLCILVSFAAGALLFSTTTMAELRACLGGVEGRVRALLGRPSPRVISLAVTLMLGFIPRFFEVWENTNLACDARSGKRGLPRLVLLIPLITERMLKAASETAEALEARGLDC